MDEKQEIYYGENFPPTENLADDKGGPGHDFVSALHQGIMAHDPDRRKALALFEKYHKGKNLDKGES
jgi:hypothetical protein